MRAVSALALVALLSLACGGMGDLTTDVPAAADPAAPTTAPTAEPTDAPAAPSGAAAPAKARPGTNASAKARPGSAGALCERLQECGCNPMTTVGACTVQMDAQIEQARTMLRKSGMGEMVSQLGGGDPIAQSVHAAANAHCRDLCSDPDLNFGVSRGHGSQGGGGDRVRIDAGADEGGAWMRVDGPGVRGEIDHEFPDDF